MPTITGTSGNNTINGSAGDDILDGAGGNDTIYGGDGADVIYGGDGNDYIDAGDNDVQATYYFDRIIAGAGHDIVRSVGFGRADIVDMGDGDDVIRHLFTRTASVVTLGEGRDTVGVNLLAPEDGPYGPDEWYNSTTRAGLARITDFAAGAGGDRLDLGGVFGLLGSAGGWDGAVNPFASGHIRFVQNGADTQIVIDRDGVGGNTGVVILTLANVVAAELTNANFLNTPPIDGSAVAGINLSGYSQTLLGGFGSDVLSASGRTVEVYIDGGFGNDTIYGGEADDTLYGEGGSDTIYGGAGRDAIDGGSGNDILYGGDGHDRIVDGAGGDDRMYGGAGNDELQGLAGDDTLEGGDGDDWLYGGVDNDRITGGNGSDYLEGGDGNDILLSGADASDEGVDIFDGGAGDDYIGAGGHHDTVRGGDGNDILVGLGLGATFEGGAGDDYVQGVGYTADIIDLGSGNDTVHLGAVGASQVSLGSGVDTVAIIDLGGNENGATVLDFAAGAGGDIVNLNGLLNSDFVARLPDYTSLARVYLRQDGANTVVLVDRDGSGTAAPVVMLTLNNVTATSLVAANFVGGLPPIITAAPPEPDPVPAPTLIEEHYARSSDGWQLTQAFSDGSTKVFAWNADWVLQRVDVTSTIALDDGTPAQRHQTFDGAWVSTGIHISYSGVDAEGRNFWVGESYDGAWGFQYSSLTRASSATLADGSTVTTTDSFQYGAGRVETYHSRVSTTTAADPDHTGYADTTTAYEVSSNGGPTFRQVNTVDYTVSATTHQLTGTTYTYVTSDSTGITGRQVSEVIYDNGRVTDQTSRGYGPGNVLQYTSTTHSEADGDWQSLMIQYSATGEVTSRHASNRNTIEGVIHTWNSVTDGQGRFVSLTTSEQDSANGRWGSFTWDSPDHVAWGTYSHTDAEGRSITEWFGPGMTPAGAQITFYDPVVGGITVQHYNAAWLLTGAESYIGENTLRFDGDYRLIGSTWIHHNPDGSVIVTELNGDGELISRDTYWDSSRSRLIAHEDGNAPVPETMVLEGAGENPASKHGPELPGPDGTDPDGDLDGPDGTALTLPTTTGPHDISSTFQTHVVAGDGPLTVETLLMDDGFLVPGGFETLPAQTLPFVLDTPELSPFLVLDGDAGVDGMVSGPDAGFDLGGLDGHGLSHLGWPPENPFDPNSGHFLL